MANAGTFYKEAHDILPITINYDGVLPGDISSDTVTAVDGDGTDATATVIDSSSYSGKVLTIVVKAGSDDETYTITAQVSDGTYQVEENVTMKVRDNYSQ